MTTAGTRLHWALCFVVWIGTFVSSSARAEQTEAATRVYAAAAALQNRGVYDLAAEEWTKFLQAFPADERGDLAHFYRGVCYLQSNQLREAAHDFERVGAAFPQSAKVPDAMLNRGIVLFRLSDSDDGPAALDAAIQSLKGFVERFPENPQRATGVFYLAEAQYATAAYDAAISSYERFLNDFPEHAQAPDALYGLGVAQVSSGADAHATFERFLKRHADHRLAAEVELRLGEVHAGAGEWQLAQQQFGRAAARDFALADLALLRQAECLERLGEMDQAAAVFAKLVERFPNSEYRGAALIGAGRCHFAEEHYQQAHDVVAPLLEEPLGAERIAAEHLRAMSLLKLGRAEAAAQLADELLSALPAGDDAAQMQLVRAEALYAQPEKRHAALDAYRAVENATTNDALLTRALYGAALAAQQLGEHAQVLAASERFNELTTEHALQPEIEFVAAESLMQLGQPGEAADRFDRLLKQFAESPHVAAWRLRSGWARYLAEQPQETIARLAPHLEQLPTAEAKAEALYLMGLAYVDLNQPERAQESLLESVGTSDTWRRADETLLELARVERTLGEQKSAIARLVGLLNRYPDSRLLDRATMALAELHFTAADFAAAAESYQRIVEQHANSELAPRAGVGLAWSQLKSKDAAASETVATRIIADHPETGAGTEARYVRALARYEQRHFPGAIDDLEVYLTGSLNRTQRSDALYALALAEAACERPEAAIDRLTTLLREDAEYAAADKAMYELAWAYRKAGQAERSAATFAELAERYPQSSLATESLYQVGQFAYERGATGDAIAAFRAAAQQGGDTTLAQRAQHKLGWAQYRQQQFDEAAATFAEQLQRWPQGTWADDARFMQGKILFEQGDFTAAIELLVAVESPTDSEYRALALLHAGQAAARMSDFTRSRELLRQCADEFPQAACLPQVLYEQAWAAQNLDEIDDALQLYEAVTSKSNGEIAARARFMIGEICFDRGDHREAVRNFFKAAYSYDAPRWQAAAQYEAGRCFEVLGKRDQAVQSYQEVVQKFADSEQAPQARARLDELN